MSSRAQMNRVRKKLEDDPVACEFVWSIFLSAVNSYRHDTVLRPFPSQFVGEYGEKNIDVLRKTANSLYKSPNLIDSLPTQSAELFCWVLDTKNMSLRSHSNETMFPEIKRKTGQTVETPIPNYVLEIDYDQTAEERFSAIRGDRKLFYAYHGSRLDNFHSILHNGLHNHLNKNSLFGNGTYLSTELSVSMVYSPSAQGWSQSSIGDRLSCIAVCEVVDHPDVKSEIRKPRSQSLNQRSWSLKSFSQIDVPEKYYVVQNDELVRVKYLLVYGDRSSVANTSSNLLSLKSWLNSHRFEVTMLVYVAILLFIGLFNSRTFHTFYQKQFS